MSSIDDITKSVMESILLSDGEEVTYVFSDGSERTIMAIVAREPQKDLGGPDRGRAPRMVVELLNDSTNGVTSVAVGRDAIRLKERSGKSAVAHIVNSVAYADASSWTLEVR